MATRTSSRSSSRKAAAPAAPQHTAFEMYLKRAVAYHASAITVLWVIVLFFSLGAGLVLLVQGVKLSEERASRLALEQRVSDLGRGLINLNVQIENLQHPSTLTPPTAPSTAPSTTPAPATTGMSPSGTLDRGSLSPDGKKYAGYDDVTAGKMGIGVEVIGETRVRHIVIFNTKTESSGKGMADESKMSVRWKDNSTVEYDVLTLKNGKWVPSVETVKIFF